MKFRVWNYGLIGDENTWDIPDREIGPYGIVLVDIPTFDDFLTFLARYKAVGIEMGEQRGFGKGYVAAVQLPTTYSTVGQTGYPTDPSKMPRAIEEIRKLYGE